MSENGSAYAITLTIRRLMGNLERKGILPSSELQQIFDEISGELREARARGEISEEISVEATQTAEKIFLPLSRGPAAIAAEDLNASNDE